MKLSSSPTSLISTENYVSSGAIVLQRKIMLTDKITADSRLHVLFGLSHSTQGKNRHQDEIPKIFGWTESARVDRGLHRLQWLQGDIRGYDEARAAEQANSSALKNWVHAQVTDCTCHSVKIPVHITELIF